VSFNNAEKLALIYTSAGSLRSVASFTGLSRYMVTKILREGYEPKAPAVRAAIQTAFEIYKDVTQAQARVDGLPYTASIPVFVQRMPFKDGTPGDRVAALHTHYLSDRQRNQFIAAAHASGMYYAASVQSIVNLVVYNKRAEEHHKKARQPVRDKLRTQYRNKIQGDIRQQIVQGPIYTQYTPLAPTIPIEYLLQDIQNKLEAKHDPAIGDPGTARGTSILLQVDTRNGKDKKFRDKHPRPTKPRKARRNSRRAGKRR